jgi:hypothetical protein
LFTAKAAAENRDRGACISLSTVAEPRWGVATVVMLAISSPAPREEAAMRASNPPLECEIMLTFSAPVSLGFPGYA